MASQGVCLKVLGAAAIVLLAVAWPMRGPLAAQLSSLTHRTAASQTAQRAASSAMAATPTPGAGATAGYRATRPPLVIPAPKQHRSTLIMLHGLGDSGAGWAFLAQKLAADLPHTQWVFPNAPVVSCGSERSAAVAAYSASPPCLPARLSEVQHVALMWLAPAPACQPEDCKRPAPPLLHVSLAPLPCTLRHAAPRDTHGRPAQRCLVRHPRCACVQLGCSWCVAACHLASHRASLSPMSLPGPYPACCLPPSALPQRPHWWRSQRRRTQRACMTHAGAAAGRGSSCGAGSAAAGLLHCTASPTSPAPACCAAPPRCPLHPSCIPTLPTLPPTMLVQVCGGIGSRAGG